MHLRASLLVYSTLLLIGSAANADSLTYIETATATGSLGGTAFTNATLSLTGVGDSSEISSASGIYELLLPVTVMVSGIPESATLTHNIDVVDNQTSSGAGFGDFTADFAILFDDASAFSTYNLASSIGPVSGTGAINSGFSFSTPTNHGSLVLDSVSSVSFQAIDTSATAPEPSSFALLCTGLLGCAAVVRRRFISFQG
jgi:hypothetical protein